MEPARLVVELVGEAGELLQRYAQLQRVSQEEAASHLLHRALRSALGTPTKLTPAAREAVLSALSEGLSRRAAARRGGIAQATFYHWLDRDPAFGQDVERAEVAGGRYDENGHPFLTRPWRRPGSALPG
ncbi:MAG: hypothetical protein JOZ75_04295 [Candidatus Dormibacteraeota bacterium]|nr:hypothetical protein [Candidatus Dormibacteraeota bacterium]